MASRSWFGLKTIGSGKVLLSGSFTTNGSGAVASVYTRGAAFTVVKEAGTGIYRIKLGKSTSDPDVYKAPAVGTSNVESFEAVAVATVQKSTVTPYAVQVKSKTVSAAAPYVDLVVVQPGLSYTAYAETQDTEVLNALLKSGAFAHKVCTAAQRDALITTADATDFASAKTLLTAIGTALQAHDDNTYMHTTADTGRFAFTATFPPVFDADAQDVATEIKTDLNAHIAVVGAAALADVHSGLDHKSLVLSPDATTEGTCVTLANEEKARVNNHFRTTPTDATLCKYMAAASAATLTGAAAVDPLSAEINFLLVLSTGGV